MSEPTWLERVETELLRRKLPRHEVARLVTELADHVTDLADSRYAPFGQPVAGSSASRGILLSPLSPSLKDEPMSTDASVVECLGSPIEIADSAVREFRRRRNLLSRSWLAAFGTFALLPLPLLVVAWLVTMMTFGTSLEILQFGLEWSGAVPLGPAWADPADFLVDGLREGQWLDVLIVNCCGIAVLLIPAAGLSFLFGRLAGRTSRRWLWGLTASALVGLGFGASHFESTFSDLPGKSQMQFIVGFGRHPLRQCGYGLLPLAVGALVLLRSGTPAERTPA
jgi:hypothetical protein